MHHSAGIIPYKFDKDGKIKFFLGHPGGPMNGNKNFWALLKGTIEKGEDELETAIREFQEESGLRLDADKAKEHLWLVGTVQQRKDKIVTAFAMEVDDIDTSKCFSNLVPETKIPEIDKYAWLTFDEVMKYTIKTNRWFYEQIMSRLGIDETD